MVFVFLLLLVFFLHCSSTNIYKQNFVENNVLIKKSLLKIQMFEYLYTIFKDSSQNCVLATYKKIISGNFSAWAIWMKIFLHFSGTPFFSTDHRKSRPILNIPFYVNFTQISAACPKGSNHPFVEFKSKRGEFFYVLFYFYEQFQICACDISTNYVKLRKTRNRKSFSSGKTQTMFHKLQVCAVVTCLITKPSTWHIPIFIRNSNADIWLWLWPAKLKPVWCDRSSRRRYR